MSTYACIARPTSTGWEGRPCKWDGYPSGVGYEVFNLVTGYFNSDVDAASDLLIDQHSEWRSVGVNPEAC